MDLTYSRVCTYMHTTATVSTFKLTAGLCIRFQLVALLAAAVLLVRACNLRIKAQNSLSM